MFHNLPKKLSQSLRPCACTFVRQIKTSQKRAELEKPTSETLKRIRRELVEGKKALEWRQEMGDRPQDWNSKLKLFGNDDQTSDFVVLMQKPIDFRPKTIMRWWNRRKVRIERYTQQYIPERHETLGNDLAAAHFLLFRGGAVKFVGDGNWMRANEYGEFDLPTKFDPRYKVEALRCDNMTLYYEGLENLRCLDHLKSLSFHNVKTFDDWCLDRVSGSQFLSLEVLDISGTNCTSNGLSCLYRIPTLKLLIVDDPKESLQFQLTCSMLQETLPQLKIVRADSVHEDESEKIPK